jgi:hypothetical protein
MYAVSKVILGSFGFVLRYSYSSARCKQTLGLYENKHGPSFALSAITMPVPTLLHRLCRHMCPTMIYILAPILQRVQESSRSYYEMPHIEMPHFEAPIYRLRYL